MAEDRTVRKMNVQQVTDEMRRRGFTARAIRQFFGMYGDNRRDYTLDEVDRFEWSVDGQIFTRIHGDLAKKP
jgi:hypothetical protein